MRYKTKDGNLTAEYTIAGNNLRVSVDVWDEEDETWNTPYDMIVVADSLHEAMTGALVNACDIEWEQADAQCAEWGIYPPEDDE